MTKFSQMKPLYNILEEKYSKFVGSKYAVSCNSGTSAIHLALMAIGVGKGDEVIVPDFTMAACGFAVSYTGAKVVTVDCDETFCIDWRQIEKKITRRTKAIMAVHIYGRLCNMKEILRIAKKHKLKVVEDACEAQGAVYKSKANITCYSFYRNKIINAEEGGICTTDNKKYRDKMNFMKNMAFDKGRTYFHKEIGFNYRMPDAQAKLAIKSLKDYPKNAKKRKKLDDGNHNAVWVLDRLCKTKKERDFIVKNNNDARYFFKPLSTMPMWKQKIGRNALKYSKLGYYLTIKI